METDLIDHLVKGLVERKSSLEHFLSSGSAKDYETYRETVGRCAEISNMIENLSELKRRYVED